MAEAMVVDTQPERAEDWELIQKIQMGHSDAFDTIFQKYVGKIYNLAMKFFRNEADAEELVQEVFTIVLEKSGTFRGNSAFSTWLYRLTANTAITRLRKRKGVHEETYIDEFLPKFSEEGHHLTRPVANWAKDPENKLLESEILENFEESLGLLNPIDKSVVLMSDMEGMTNREIAEALDLTIPAVKSKLHRGRLFLRGKMAVFHGHSPH